MEFTFSSELANSPFIEQIWYTCSKDPGTFTSIANSHWEMVFAAYRNETIMTVRGPETKVSIADFPANAEFFGITFKLGSFMPHIPVKALLDRQDKTLPKASDHTFWLQGSTWEFPTFENVDVFINRLIHQEILVRDPVIEAALQEEQVDLSTRSLQYRFLQATGLTRKTILQIERAHSAVVLLEQGKSILDTALELGYFDQSHLTNSLKRFVGKTPAQIKPECALK